MQGISKNKMSTEGWVFFVVGLISTMPILQVKGMAVFTICAFALTPILAYKIILNYSNPFNKINNLIYCLYVCVSIVSAILCINSTMESYWRATQLTNIIWQLVLLVFLFYFTNKNGWVNAGYLLKGVYWASIIQVVWGFLQLIFYKLYGISINDVFFIEFLNLTEDATHLKYNGDIALSGFCWHVGNMTPLITFGYVFSNNIYIKGMFLIYSLICNSRTTTIGIICCVILEIIYCIKEKENKSKRKIFIIASLCIGMVALLYGEDILVKITNVFGGSLSDGSALTHMRYWTAIPKIMARSDIENILLGFGLACSGYPYAEMYSQYVGSSWVVECDFVNQLWNTGIIGFVIAYIWWFIFYRDCRKVSYKYSIFIIVLLVEGITYNVMFRWMWIVLFALYGFAMHGNENKR